MKAKVLSGSLSEDRSSKRELSTKRIKSVRLLPASLWKESPEKLHVQSRSSPDSESGSENEKTVKLLHKYQNESVDGPLQKTDKKFSYKKSAFEDVDVNQSVKSPIRAHNKPWQTQSCSPIKSKGLEHRKGSPKTASGKSGSNRSSFSFNNPSILRSGGHTKLHKCQNCVKRRQNSRTAGTQTDALHEIVPNQDELIEKVVEKSLHNADMLLYHLPVGVESSESASYSTEDTSSMTFDDDDVIHYVTPVSEPRSPVSRSDILFRIDEIQTKLQQIKEDTGCGLLQVRSKIVTNYCFFAGWHSDERHRYRRERFRVRFPGRLSRSQCRQRVATAAMFLRTCVAEALSLGGEPRHSLHASA